MIAKITTRGHSTPNHSFVVKQSKFHTAVHDKWYQKDVAKAKALIKACNYQGQELEIITTKKYVNMYRQAIALQAQLSEVGVNAKVTVLEWPVLLKRFVDKDYQICSYAIGSRPNPTNAYEYLARSNIFKTVPRFEELLAMSKETADDNEKIKIFDEMHELMVEHVPAIVMFNTNQTPSYWNYVKGFKVFATGHPRLWNVRLEK